MATHSENNDGIASRSSGPEILDLTQTSLTEQQKETRAALLLQLRQDINQLGTIDQDYEAVYTQLLAQVDKLYAGTYEGANADMLQGEAVALHNAHGPLARQIEDLKQVERALTSSAEELITVELAKEIARVVAVSRCAFKQLWVNVPDFRSLGIQSTHSVPDDNVPAPDGTT